MLFFLIASMLSCSPDVPAAGQAGDRVPAANSAPAAAADTGHAILQQGPFPITGIDVLAPNAIAASQVFYNVNGIQVQVLGARGEILYTGTPAGCAAVNAIELDSATQTAFGFEAAPGLHFFFVFPRGYADSCAFIAGFIKRFEYFRTSAEIQKDIPFPAVFEL